MEYSVEQEYGSQTVVLRVNGMVNSKLAEVVVVSAGSALSISGFRKCLFDLSGAVLDPQQSMAEMFIFADVFQKALIDRSISMAAVVPEINEKFLVLEKSAIANGFSLKHFENRGDAIDWLG